jgi:hypothetical protein
MAGRSSLSTPICFNDRTIVAKLVRWTSGICKRGRRARAQGGRGQSKVGRGRGPRGCVYSGLSTPICLSDKSLAQNKITHRRKRESR